MLIFQAQDRTFGGYVQAWARGEGMSPPMSPGGPAVVRKHQREATADPPHCWRQAVSDPAPGYWKPGYQKPGLEKRSG